MYRKYCGGTYFISIATALFVAIPLQALGQDAATVDASRDDSATELNTSTARSSSSPAPSSAPSAAPENPTFIAPVVITHARPAYPSDGDGHRVEVELLVTVDVHGTVSDVEVLGHIPSSAPPSFDASAVEAARTMRFVPARRDGLPIPVRVRYHAGVIPPIVAAISDEPASGRPPEVAEIDDDLPPQNPGSESSSAPPSNRTAMQRTIAPQVEHTVVVEGIGTPDRSATEYAIPIGHLAHIPRIDATEALLLVPGVSVTNEATAGDPPEVYLRGFSGDNGQDIAFSVAGIPINDESNPLTHGTADLYFVIPELIDQLDVTEGVADPRQGNFAIAGSIDYRLGLNERGLTARASLGMFGYRRIAGFYGPPQSSRQSFIGFEAVHSDGFGTSRNYDRFNGMAQHVINLGRGFSLHLLASAYSGTWVNPGVLRQDDFDAGRVGFFDVYGNTGNQGGSSQRMLAAVSVEYSRPLEHAELRLWGQYRDFKEIENDDGFAEDPVHGDLLSERYTGGTFGARGFYRRGIVLGGHIQEVEMGFLVRHDRFTIHEQNLDVATNAPPVPPNQDDNSAIIHVTNPAFYAEATARPFEWLTLRGGLRADIIAYDVAAYLYNDVSGAFGNEHRSALGIHLGPKATLAIGPWHNFRILVSYGSGFRSPDARGVADSGPVLFTQVETEDATLRYNFSTLTGATRVIASLTGFHTSVSHDEIFDPTMGTTVAVGPTERLGFMAATQLQLFQWIDLNAWVAYTYATVQTASLDGQLQAGAPMPYLPAIVARADAACDRQIAVVRGLPVRVRAGIAATVRGPVPMITTPRTEPTVLVDAGTGVRIGNVAVDIAARNLLDARWHSADFEYASTFDQSNPSSTPVRHFVAGAPLTVFATVTLHI